MKVIAKSDLMILLEYSDDESFDLDDFKSMLDKWGDDYFLDDGALECDKRNENMATIRDYYRRIRHAN